MAVVARGHRLDVFAVDELDDARCTSLAEVRGARVFEHHLAELCHLLAELDLAVAGDDARGGGIIDDDRLQALGAHDGAGAAAGGVAGGAAFGVRDGNRGAGHAAFTGGADGGRGAGHQGFADQFAVEVVVRSANEVTGLRKARAIAVDIETVKAVVRGAIDHQRLDTQARQPVAELPADVRLLRTAGERALEGEACAAARRHRCPPKQSGAEEEFRVTAEGVDTRVCLFKEHGGAERTSPEQRIAGGRGLFGD